MVSDVFVAVLDFKLDNTFIYLISFLSLWIYFYIFVCIFFIISGTLLAKLSFLFLRSSVKLWASAFGGEIKSISAKYSGSQLLQKVFFLFPRLANSFSVYLIIM